MQHVVILQIYIVLIITAGTKPLKAEQAIQQQNNPKLLAAQHLKNSVQLVSDGFAAGDMACSGDTLLSTELDGMALPTLASNFTVSVAISTTASQAVFQTDETLLSFGGVTMLLNRLHGWLTLSTLSGDYVRYSLSGSAISGPTVYTVVVADKSRFRACWNFSCPIPVTANGFLITTETSWISLRNNMSKDVLALTNLTLGSSTSTSIAGTILGVWTLPSAVAVDTLASQGVPLIDVLQNITTSTNEPSITLDASSSMEGVVVDASVRAVVNAASSSGLGVRLRLTFYGASPSNCQQSSCGDVMSEFYSKDGSVQGSVAVKYSRAGRYIIRAQASDMMAGWSSKDFELIVRKVGDSQATAPCCRSSAQIIAQQLGRPIDPKNYRPSWINASATAIGWDWDYLQGREDAEAERLFDYGLLAPVNIGPWKPFSCQDKYLAGYGSPTAWGVAAGNGIGKNSNLGRNKRIAILPEGFSWASNPSGWTQLLPTCVTHWSSWIANTPYGRLDPSTGAASCSYTCTPDGVQQLVSVTGTYDRWAEAVIENSYGTLSLMADPVILDTLYMPKGAEGGQNAFAYSEAPVHDHLRNQGIDLYRDFHTIVVLSPLPRFINSGFTAWANAGGSPFIFVMRCNPQHYYLVHEFGHRVGMSHATVYKLDGGTDSQPPTSPLGPGVMEDTYSDRLDIMACCKGDYSLQNRILSGWVPGAERVTLSLADLAVTNTGSTGEAGGPVVRRYTLWPFDRPESKGRLKGVSLRVEDGKILVLGFRSTPYWQDVRIKRSSAQSKSDERQLAPEHMRTNVAGLSVEYSKRYLEAAGAPTWSIRGLLDFNLAFTRFPAALPPKPGMYPPDPPGAVFTLLREGDAWLDEDHNLLIAVERITACSQEPLVPVYSYAVPNFYGFRGENPGEEQVKRADYSGYADDIKCLQLRVVSGVTAAPGTLDVRVRVQGMDDSNRLVLGGDQCGFPVTPKLQLVLPSDVDIISIVWRDNLNRTVALDTAQVVLPSLAPLAEASVDDTDHCNVGCDWRYHVKVLAADGAQTGIDISIGTVSLGTFSLTATYSYYLRRSILQATEYHSIPVVQRIAQQATAGQGRQLLEQAVPLEILGKQVFELKSLPDSTCSKQWTISLSLDIPASALQAPADGTSSLTQLVKAYATEEIGIVAPGWPVVSLKVSSIGTSLLVVWGDGLREQAVNFASGKTNQLAVIRNRDRLGIWVNGDGGWLLDSVWCAPDSQSVKYCSKAAGAGTPDEPDTTLRALRLGQSTGSSGIVVSSARVYNYAIPRLNLLKEAACSEEDSCGRFLLAGWRVPDASTVPAGTIDLQGTVPSVASTPIKLNSNTHYLLVGPWSECSARCGGGWATREVRCMRLQGSNQPAAQVPLEECPLGEDIPASSKQCNTAACPTYSLQLLASQHSTCGRGCTLLGSDVDGAQLLCLDSLGRPQPLLQCCTHCSNISDWASVPWVNSISALLNPGTSTLGGSVQVLQPAPTPNPTSNATLAAMMLQGSLHGVCQPRELCVGGVKWQLGRWSPCSNNCGGGTKRRSAVCVSPQTGDAVSDHLCINAMGAVPKELLTAECGSRPCSLHTWQVGSWSSCGGDASFGHSSRTVACVDSKGVITTAANCPSPAPASSVICLKSSQSAVCRPSFIAEQQYGSQDCYGHGTCTMNGCVCKVGWHGQFCEVPASCTGVMSKAGKCCASGVLDVRGVCCPEDSVVDKAGVCCEKGRIDKCGVCGGNNWAIDIMGSCCNSVLDALGSCCTSGAVDECGVCDGDGTSCNLHMRLLVNLPNTTDLTSAASAWRATLQSMLQAALQQPSKAKSSSVLHLLEIKAEWAPVVTEASRLVPSRTLLTADGSTQESAPNNPDNVEQQDTTEQLVHQAAEGQHPLGHCQYQDLADALLTSSVCRKDDAVQHEHAHSAVVGNAAVNSDSRHLLASGANTSSWRAAIVNVLASPVQPTSSFSTIYTSTAAAAANGAAVLGIGYVMATSLQQQVGVSKASARDEAVLQLERIMLVQRLGVCGNGVCEVGERGLLNAEGHPIMSAAAPCPQDCPYKFSMCPAPLGQVGKSALECGGNGKCVRSQGVCDCFAGYTGDACDQCEASFWHHQGRCVPQYIQGRNIFDPILLESQEKFTGLVFLIIAAIVGALGLLSGAWVFYHWLRFGRLPKAMLKRLYVVRTKTKLALLGKRPAKDDGVSKKYLLDIELELSGKTVKHPRSDGGAIEIQDASVLSKSGILRHRTSTIGTAGDAEGSNGDLLKAIRANMLQDSAEISEAPMSPMKERLSHVLGGRITGGGGPRYSSLGGGDMPVQPPRTSLSKTMSEVYNNIQRGLSEAGGGIARVVSNSVSRLSSSAGSGYQRMRGDEDGSLLTEDPASGMLSAESAEQTLQYLDASQVTLELGRGAARLDGAEGLATTDSHELLQRGSSPGGAAVPFHSSFGGLSPSQAATAAQQYVSSGGGTASTGGSTFVPPGMPHLARIKTRTDRLSEGSPGTSAAGSGAYDRGVSSEGGAGQASSLRRTRLATGSSTVSSIPGHAVASAPAIQGLRAPVAAAAGGAAFGPTWRTRAEYEAALQSGSEPVLPAHLLEQAKGRKSPSEPGMLHGQKVRGQAGLPEFVPTPLSGQEPTNREAIEAFGHRMERWFSPSNAGSSNSSSDNGGWSRSTTAAGALAQLAAQHRAAVAARPQNDVTQDSTTLTSQTAGSASDTDGRSLAMSMQPSRASSVAAPRQASGAAELQLPVSTGLASGSGDLLTGSWFTPGERQQQQVPPTQQQAPQSQAESGSRIVSFKAWHQQADGAKESKDGTG